MSTSATWIVSNPSPGQEYIAPSAYWVIPNGGTSVSVTVQTFDGSGNLQTVSSLTAICRNISGNSDASSYTYSGGDGATSTTSNGVNGGNVFAPAGKVGSGCGQLRMYISYTGRQYDQPPNAPSNLSPNGTITTLTPVLTANFSDPTSGDTLAQYEYQVTNASNGGGSQIWDTGNVAANSSETSAAQSSRTYAGSALAYGSSYSWRARHANQNGNWGPWSGWTNFNTIQGPNAPTNVQPSGTQAGLTPAFSFGYSSPAATAMASYHYNIYSGAAQIYDSGEITASVASGGSVSGTIPSAAGLQYGGSYSFNVWCHDTNGAVSQGASSTFSISSLATATPSSPVGGATVNAQTPTLAWSYTAGSAGYTQAKYQVQVINRSTSALLWDSGQVSSAATSVVCGATIAWNTPISWRVQVWDTAGNGSGYSAYAAALVNNTPTASITNPANNSSVLTNTPTVSWTYTPSAGGYAQSSAVIALADSNGNALGNWTLTGAGTSWTFPAGVLVNTHTYRVTVTVTDTNNSSGASATIAFTLSYAAPADMAGQPLASGKNWILGALLNSDSGNGVAVDWTESKSTGVTATASIDPNVTQSNQQGNGDGPISGAQRIGLSGGVTTAGQYAHLTQQIPLATPGWVAGTTVLSAWISASLQVLTGSPTLNVTLEFWNGSTFLSNVKSASPVGDTAGQFVRLLGGQGVTIPANTTIVKFTVELIASAAGDTAIAEVYGAQLEAGVSASDAHFIEGSLGTGYSYDANGYSVRTQIAGGMPTLTAAPGADTDPISASGGTSTFGWDTTLADATRFYAYLVERRRQDQVGDDSAWLTLATLTNKSQGSYTDYSAGSNTTYQYAVRQQITYSDGTVGVSANRAMVVGSVSFSPAWYLTNTDGLIYNVRLKKVQAQRTLAWKERATYSAFLGRIGSARDGGPPAGYTHTLVCSFDDAWGDSRPAVRRQFVAMQELGVVWYLKDPEGLVVPVFLQDVQFDETDNWGDTLLKVTLSLLQAKDTSDY